MSSATAPDRSGNPQGVPSNIEPLHIEGTTLEGGGQILRLSVGLSALMRIPIHITNIRANRYGGGGLKAQHLTGVEWLGRKAGANRKGVSLKSRELVFKYGDHGVEEKELKRDGVEKDLEQGMKELGLSDGKQAISEQGGNGEVWDIRQDTPGSVNLVFQAVLPYILFSSEQRVERAGDGDENGHPRPITLRIQGGTNVSNSPSYEYVSQVLVPMLSKIGIPPIEPRLLERGWSSAGRDQATTLGRVEYVVTPLSKPLPAFKLLEIGDIISVKATILAPKVVEARFREILDEVLDRYRSQIFGAVDTSDIDFEVTFEDSLHLKRYYLLLVATTSTGLKIGRDWLYDGGFKRSSVEDATTKRLVNKVVMDLAGEIQRGGCVDEYLRDQLVVFQGLAEGKSEIFGGREGREVTKGSLHARTAQWVVGKMLGVEFDEEGACKGIGY